MGGCLNAAADFECVAEGIIARVLLSPKAKEEYDAVLAGTDERSVRRRTRLTRYFAQFCEHEPHRLKDEAYKHEGAFSDGQGGTVAVSVFKAWQWRLYGAVLQVGGRKCFIGVLVDPEKKQDRADQAMLKAAALRVAELAEYKPDVQQNTNAAGGGKNGRGKRR
jgi:hypothetical protein